MGDTEHLWLASDKKYSRRRYLTCTHRAPGADVNVNRLVSNDCSILQGVVVYDTNNPVNLRNE